MELPHPSKDGSKTVAAALATFLIQLSKKALPVGKKALHGSMKA
jgi:hypothetical protein